MTKVARSTLWAGVPIVFLVGWFVLIALINWDYQIKFFKPALVKGEVDGWMGPLLLLTVVAFGLTSSAFAFLASWQMEMRARIYVMLSLIVSLVLFLMGLIFLLFSPAAITMMEQINT